jgi:hypothetical protein
VFSSKTCPVSSAKIKHLTFSAGARYFREDAKLGTMLALRRIVAGAILRYPYKLGKVYRWRVYKIFHWLRF